MIDQPAYTDTCGPLEISTATYEQELFYCEFSHEQLEQVRVAFGGDLKRASEAIKEIITIDVITEIISKIPEDWLLNEGDFLSPKEMRNAYTTFLNAKLSMIDKLVKEAEDAR